MGYIKEQDLASMGPVDWQEYFEGQLFMPQSPLPEAWRRWERQVRLAATKLAGVGKYIFVGTQKPYITPAKNGISMFSEDLHKAARGVVEVAAAVWPSDAQGKPWPLEDGSGRYYVPDLSAPVGCGLGMVTKIEDSPVPVFILPELIRVEGKEVEVRRDRRKPPVVEPLYELVGLKAATVGANQERVLHDLHPFLSVVTGFSPGLGISAGNNLQEVKARLGNDVAAPAIALAKIRLGA